MSTVRCKDCRWCRKSPGDGEGPCGHWRWQTFTHGEPMPCGGALYLPPVGTGAYRAHQGRLHVRRQRRYRDRIRKAGDKIVTLRMSASEAELLRILSRDRGLRPQELIAKLLAIEEMRGAANSENPRSVSR